MATDTLVKEITTLGSPYLGQVPKKLKVLLYWDNDLVISSVTMIIQIMAFCIIWTLYFIEKFTPKIQKSIKSQSKLTEICSSGNVTCNINCICE